MTTEKQYYLTKTCDNCDNIQCEMNSDNERVFKDCKGRILDPNYGCNVFMPNHQARVMQKHFDCKFISIDEIKELEE